MYTRLQNLRSVEKKHKTTHEMIRWGHKAYHTIDKVFTLPDNMRQGKIVRGTYRLEETPTDEPHYQLV